MKYRIIEEVDGNDKHHFEVEFWKRGIFGYRWFHTQEYRHDFPSTKRFGTYEEAKEFVNTRKRTRVVVEEGEV